MLFRSGIYVLAGLVFHVVYLNHRAALQDAELGKNERQAYRQQVYSYCNEQLQAGEEIALQELAQELPKLGEKDFQQFSVEQGYALEESFPADRGTLRQLTKFAGSGGGLSINFDALLLGRAGFFVLLNSHN